MTLSHYELPLSSLSSVVLIYAIRDGGSSNFADAFVVCLLLLESTNFIYLRTKTTVKTR